MAMNGEIIGKIDLDNGKKNAKMLDKFLENDYILTDLEINYCR